MTPELMKRYAEWSHLLPEVLGWYHKVELTGLNITKIDKRWRMIVKANKNGKPVVKIFYANSYYDLFVLLGADVKAPIYAWKPDRYAP